MEKRLYTPPEPAALMSPLETIVKIIIITIVNVVVMFGIFALGAAGGWQNPGDPLKGIFPLIVIGCAWLLFSFIFSIRLWLHKENHKAVTVSARVIPITLITLFSFAAAFAVIREIVVAAAPYFGFEIPCAFKWPPCPE